LARIDLHDRQPGLTALSRSRGRPAQQLRPPRDLVHGLHPEVLVLRRGDIDQIERPVRSSQVPEGVGMLNIGAIRETSVRKISLDGSNSLVAEIDECAMRSA